ncbi:MAG: hypothetical protein O3A14_17530 [Cyanobacteria bacterium]|nr:hypothetical protein [Cyanobacteriota bacterium]
MAKVAEALLAEKLDDAADALGQQITEASRRQGMTPEQWQRAALAQFAEVSQKKRRQKGGDVGNSDKKG